MKSPYIRIEEFIVKHPEEYPFGRVRVRAVEDEDGRHSVALAIENESADAEIALTPDETVAIADALRRAANEAADLSDESDGFEPTASGYLS